MHRGAVSGLSAVLLLCAAVIGTSARAPLQNSPGQRPALSSPTQSTQFPEYPRVNVASGYRWVKDWPQKPSELVWGMMSSMAIDGTGNIWTFNRGTVPIQIYRPDGALVRTWGQGGLFKNPHQIRFDKEGNLWAVDNGFNTVRKFSPSGEVLLTLGTKNEPGDDDKHFNQPTDVAVTPSGEIFVSDGYVNSRVVHFDRNGRFVKAWGKLGTGPGEFSLPHGIGRDSHGRLYVVDRNNARVQVFEESGKYVTEWRNIITPWAISITAKDEIFVVGSTPSQWWEVPKDGVQMNGVPAKDQIVVKFDTEGRVKELWAFPHGTGDVAAPGELSWVHGIAVDAKGNLYLGDVRGRSAQKFARVEAGAPAQEAR